MSGTGSERRGPRRLADHAIWKFLGESRPAALCVESPSGALRSTPIRIAESDHDELRLIAADPALVIEAAQRGAAACVVADEFETYEGIRGVIVQGVLREGELEDPAVVLTPTKSVGFSFAGTLPPELSGSGANEVRPVDPVAGRRPR